MTTTAKHQILIVGGGTAGITVAARMLRKGYTDVAVIEPSSTHYYQPLWTLVGGGQAKASTTERAESSVMPKRRDLDQERRQRPSTRTTTRSPAPTGRPMPTTCSWSVPGIQLDWNRTEGLEDALGRDGVSSNYRFDLAPRTWDFIRNTAIGHRGVHHAVRADQVRRRAAEDRLPGQPTTGESRACSTTSTSTSSCRHRGCSASRRSPTTSTRSSPTTASPCTPTPR